MRFDFNGLTYDLRFMTFSELQGVKLTPRSGRVWFDFSSIPAGDNETDPNKEMELKRYSCNFTRRPPSAATLCILYLVQDQGMGQEKIMKRLFDATSFCSADDVFTKSIGRIRAFRRLVDAMMALGHESLAEHCCVVAAEKMVKDFSKEEFADLMLLVIDKNTRKKLWRGFWLFRGHMEHDRHMKKWKKFVKNICETER